LKTDKTQHRLPVGQRGIIIVQDSVNTQRTSNKAMSDLKPGQKFATPTPGFGDRVFYETLYRQRPDSAMAQEW